MKTLILFRHGLATHSLDGYGDQILTASILPEGIPPIERMGAFLKEVSSDINFVSPVQRCQQTAEIITNVSGKTFQTDQRLSEYQAEVRDESFARFKERCQSFLDEVQARPLDIVLVCSHGAVVAAFQHLFLKKDFSEKDLIDYPATGELLVIRNGKVESFDFNEGGAI